MKKILFFAVLFISFSCFGQENLNTIRTKSWQTFAYKITAADAEMFQKWDSIPVNKYKDENPFLIFHADSVQTNKLGIGNFLLLSVTDNNVIAEFVNNTDLIMLTINNQDKLQIDVRNRAGVFMDDASVFVNEKPALFDKVSKTYWVNERNVEEAFVKIYSKTDTLFRMLKNKQRPYESVAKQRKRNFKRTKLFAALNWMPFHVKQIFKKNRYRSNYRNDNGYIIFNQPKYKPLDTLRFKAYAVNRKWKQLTKTVNVFVDYYSKGKYYSHLVQALKPASAGAYVGSFLLADSLPSDTRYTFTLKTLRGKDVLSNTFKIEEYVLDEVGTYTFKADESTYYKNDSIRFFASAKDANGLNLLDGKATLIATVNAVNTFYKDTVFVIDTLFKQEVKLATVGDTKFVIPTSHFAHANVDITAKLIFKNANNELHEEEAKIEYKYFSRELKVTQEQDSIKAVFMVDGIETSASGAVEIDDADPILIRFPFSCAIDPTVNQYDFSLNDNTFLNKTAEVNDNYSVNLNTISNSDTLGFVLNNPNKIPVYYSVFAGEKMIATNKSTGAEIKWEKQMSNPRQMYKVRWQYYWAGREKSQEENIGLYYKRLNINVAAKDNVFPGQKDSIKIIITDYKGKPASNVNLTAVSYNNQFKKDINVKSPPYLVRYKSKGYITRAQYKDEEVSDLKKVYSLGKYDSWIKKFSLDTMMYYKLLFPKNGKYVAFTSIGSFIPQVSINLVSKGVPQEIYLLYLNKQLVYYNGVTDKMRYAYEVYPGYAQIILRTKNKLITIDSVYIQPNYKHDISFNLDNLPKNSTIIEVKNYWDYWEMDLLERSMWRMQNDYDNNNALLWQGNKIVRLSGDNSHIAGPFLQDSINFFSPNKFDMKFYFEHGYEYKITDNVLRLEKMPLFAKKDTNNLLINYSAAMLKLGDTIPSIPQIYYKAPVQQKFILTTNTYTHYSYPKRKSGFGRIQFISNKDTSIQYVILFSIDKSKVVLVTANHNNSLNNLEIGNYNLFLVSNNFYTAVKQNIVVKKDGYTCVKMDSIKFVANNALVDSLITDTDLRLKPK
jgi:alpha-2-macroglobulin